MVTPFVHQPNQGGMRLATQARVLFADTDQMGVVYHASYLRYLELARVELVRAAGLSVPTFEPLGLALPLTEIAVRYRAFAKYDDLMSVWCGISLLSAARLHFDYVITVEPGHRVGHDARVEVLWAQTRHVCIRLADSRPARLPAEVVSVLESCYTSRED
jgi:acyl-CoA thioester hydrolase